MRWIGAVVLTACVGSSPPPARVVPEPTRAKAREAVKPAPPQVSPGRSAEQLLDDAGIATYLADHDLTVGSRDGAAMERWFADKPGEVYVHAERVIQVPGGELRASCQRVARRESGVLNEVAAEVWRRAGHRTILELGQTDVVALDERTDQGSWITEAVRSLPVGAVTWTDEKIVYAEGAVRHEVACVPVVREVACDAGGRAHCVGRELVVRPWLPPRVPHIGPVIPAYDDSVPELPPSDCAVTCEPSACDEALRRTTWPTDPLYEQDAPTLAVFRTREACRAYARSRSAAPSDADRW